jgi:hypothetical protein
MDILKVLDGISSTNLNTVVLRPPSLSLTDANHLNMTLVSNDPSWWPMIAYIRGQSYLFGSCRESGLAQILTMVSQLYASLWWYMNGVSHAMLMRKLLTSLPLQH